MDHRRPGPGGTIMTMPISTVITPITAAIRGITRLKLLAIKSIMTELPEQDFCPG